jgi:hypothetical protein
MAQSPRFRSFAEAPATDKFDPKLPLHKRRSDRDRALSFDHSGSECGWDERRAADTHESPNLRRSSPLRAANAGCTGGSIRLPYPLNTSGTAVTVKVTHYPASGRARSRRDSCPVRRRNDRAWIGPSGFSATDYPTRRSGLASPRRDNRRLHSQGPTPSKSAPTARHRSPSRRIDGLVPSEQNPAPDFHCWGARPAVGRPPIAPECPPELPPSPTNTMFADAPSLAGRKFDPGPLACAIIGAVIASAPARASPRTCIFSFPATRRALAPAPYNGLPETFLPA